MVYHAINNARGNQKAQLWFSKAFKIEGRMKIGKAQHGYPVASVFQNPANDGVTKRGMIHIGFAYYKDEVGSIPPLAHTFLMGNW